VDNDEMKLKIAVAFLKDSVALERIIEPIQNLREEIENMAKRNRIPIEEVKKFVKDLIEKLLKESPL